MINWIDKQDESWEGTFKSDFFRNDENEQNLFICIEDSSLANYAEECVKSLNNLPEDLIDKLCTKIIKCAKKGGMDESFKLPELENAVDILNYCWFTTVYVITPAKASSISYIVEGEGEWGEVIGFVIKNNRLAYVGVDYFEHC